MANKLAIVKKPVCDLSNLTTALAGVGVKPVITASIPRTERVPVAYKFLKAQPSSLSLSISGVKVKPPKDETNCAP